MIIYAVVIAYMPDKLALQKLCQVLERDCSVIVVDNTPVDQASIILSDVIWVSMNGNAGIAAAQNAGILTALDRKAEAIAFFDQDSQPTESLIPRLASVFGERIQGVVAPVCIDMRTGNEYMPTRITKIGLAKPVKVLGEAENMKVDMVISSGSLVAAEVFGIAGMMDEDFFIDYVDLEWCIRCRKFGVQITVAHDVVMPHAIGDKVVNNGPLTTFVHSPIRSYYRLRNAFLLFRKHHVPITYSLYQVASAIVHHFLQLPHSQNRLMHFRYGVKALVDGIMGVVGEIDKKSNAMQINRRLE